MTGLTSERAEQLDQLIIDASRAAGLDPQDAQLIAYSANAVFRLTGDIIARINIQPGYLERTKRLVSVARWLQSCDAPIAPIVPEIAQPIVGPSWSATFWSAQPRPDQLTAADLARPLQVFHGLRPPEHVGEWRKFAVSRRRLDHADGVDPSDIEWFRNAWNRVEQEYTEAYPQMPQGLIHGDAHRGNLLRSQTGRPVLCDLDSVSHGPTDWDLVPTAVYALRFGQPAEHAGLVAAYGRDVTQTPWWPILRRIRELVMVTYVLPDLAGRPNISRQWSHRMYTLREGLTNACWEPY